MDRYVYRLELLVVFGLLIALLVLAGLGFVAAAIYLSLAVDLGPTGAALVTGSICFGVAVVVALIAWLAVRALHKPQKAETKASDAIKLALTVGEALGGDLKTMAKTHRLELIGIALAAGFAVGVSPKLRKSLRDLLQ